MSSQRKHQKQTNKQTNIKQEQLRKPSPGLFNRKEVLEPTSGRANGSQFLTVNISKRLKANLVAEW